MLTLSRYNNSQQARGYPDLAANGNGVLTVQDGAYTLDYGTSCSAPIIGGFITQINEQRINVGKSTVGFINPVLYSNTRKFNDITVGNNSGCGTGGFSAVTGVSILSPIFIREDCNMTCVTLEEVAC